MTPAFSYPSAGLSQIELVSVESSACTVATDDVMREFPQSSPGKGLGVVSGDSSVSIATIGIALLLCGPGMASAPAFPQQQPSPKDQSRPTNLDELTVEELMAIRVDKVYGASKFEQKITDAPSSVTIISSDQIRKYGYRTLADIFRSVPGFYVNDDRNYTYVGMRGFARPGDYNTRLLILVDGHEMNDDVYGEAFVGTEFSVDVDLIERIEIIRGPGSAVYGTGAFLSVINVITKKGSDLHGVEVSASGGGLQSFEGRVSYGQRFAGGLDLVLSGTDYDSKGYRQLFFPEFNSPANNNGIAQDADTDMFHSFFSAADFRGFTLRGAYSSREKRIPTASFGTVFNDRRTLTTDTRSYLDLQYRHTFDPHLELAARVFYDRYRYDAVYVYDTAGQPDVLNQDFARGEWFGLEVSVSKRLFTKHRVTVGAEERFNLKQIQGNYDAEPYQLILFDNRSSTVQAVYAQDEFALRNHLVFSAGVRADHYYSFGTTVNPRLALVWSPRDNTTLKVLYGHAFRAPNDYEQYYYQNGISPLRPEIIHTTELVFERYLSTRTWVRASGFYNVISHLISQTTDPATGSVQFINLEGVRSKGLEAELNSKLVSGWEGRASYTLQTSTDSVSGDVLSNSPKQMAKLNLIAPAMKNTFFAGVEGQYTSRRRTVGGTDVGGFLIANLTLSTREFARRLQLSGSVYNMFGKRYADPGGEEHQLQGIRQDGRNFRIKLIYRFQ
jgi:outer membrane receptor for ferrienterochelin and colicins